MSEAVFEIGGMTCQGCVNAVTRVLSAVKGVTKTEVDLEHGHARVEGDADPQTLIAAVTRAGFTAKSVN